MNEITCQISLGELVDKITILEIKSEKITDSAKLEHISKELNTLNKSLDELNLSGLTELKAGLKEVNGKLWVIEDDIREKERNSVFDDEFIQLARSVYVTNDERFRLKNTINTKFGSHINEVKSYKEY
jgi:peptidoglycan hydrolase CwlO-like protein